MKKLMLSVILMAFAVAVQAGDSKNAQDKPACCAKKASAQAAGATCTANKGKTACAAGACEKTPVRQALLSPKAASEAGR
jgi:hypothetical protein